ncbi:MAG: acylphosphatase [Pseudomonadota bacterium]|nr:acylphosphatase [Pseudomonadota bacterium]
MSHVAFHVRITGQVQGVFFRAWTAEHARQLNVSGWVRNAQDGSVEAQLEGEKWSVQQLIDLLHRGPPSAQVDRVAVEDAEPNGTAGFEVRH